MRKTYGVILAVIGYILFFFYMEGWGEDWKVIGEDVQGTAWEIDVAGISLQPNNIVRAWLKKTYSKKGVTDWVKNFGDEYKDFSYLISLEEYHCTEKTYRIIRLTTYSLGGEAISKEVDPSAKWGFIIPNSMAEAVFKEVCK